MSFAGLGTFLKNAETVIESESFKNADEPERWQMLYSLLNSKYGVGSFMGLGTVKELKIKGGKNESN